MHRTFIPLATVTLATLCIAGCRVDEHKDKDGKNENVSIQTPFGSTSIKTNNDGDTSGIGLTAYPGSVPVKQDNGKSNNNADINLSFGEFHLGVKAASLQTSDGEDAVLAFYRKDMAKYGDVIECRGDSAVGKPTRTGQGLTCDDKGSKSHHSSDDDLELRAGSETHQHIVGLEAKDGGTKIGLVMLDLPSHLSDNSKKPE